MKRKKNIASRDVGTATTDIPSHISSSMTAAHKRAMRDKLSSHILALYMKESFFSAILRSVTRICTDEIPTMGVSLNDGGISLWWNPSFFEELEKNPNHVEGVLKHEAYHIIYQHITIRRRSPHNVWNWSTDLAINSLIERNYLPDGCLIPGEKINLKDDVRERIMKENPRALERVEILSQKFKSFPLKKSSDWYYGELMSDPETRKAAEELEAIENIFKNGDHTGWDKISEEEKEILKKKIEIAMKNAIKNADQNNSWGSVSFDTQKQLRELYSNAVDWKSVLRYFTGTHQRALRSTSFKKINKKYPYIHPGVKKAHCANIGIYIDQSGSVSDENVEEIFSVLASLSKRVTFHVHPFDTMVDEDNSFIWRRGQRRLAIRVKSGGTDFQAPTDHANKNRDKYDAIIIATDGECEKPSSSFMKRMWLIVPKCKLLFVPDQKDMVITMSEKED